MTMHNKIKARPHCTHHLHLPEGGPLIHEPCLHPCSSAPFALRSTPLCKFLNCIPPVNQLDLYSLRKNVVRTRTNLPGVLAFCNRSLWGAKRLQLLDHRRSFKRFLLNVDKCKSRTQIVVLVSKRRACTPWSADVLPTLKSWCPLWCFTLLLVACGYGLQWLTCFAARLNHWQICIYITFLPGYCVF